MSGSLSSLYGGRGIAIARDDGSRVFDSCGNEYLDFFNGHGAALFGHSNETLIRALKDASEGVWSCGAGFESSVREELADELASLIGGGRVFFTNSGTEAIEAALKLAAVLRPGRKRILACRRAFHGRSCGALSVTFNPKYRAPFASLIPHAEHLNPEALAEHIDNDTFAIFVEPVQGEGGVFPIEPEVGRAISEACRANGAILIADEVQTGLGRCGAPLAAPLAGLDPDITCVAKGLAGGLPAGAVLWKKELGDFPPHSHGSTYGGNELVCSVALAAMKLLKDENFSKKALNLGELLRSEIRKIESPHIKDVRGMGLLNGIELDIPSLDVVKALQAAGLLSLAAGPRVLRFLPSFAASEEDIRLGAKKLAETLNGNAI